MKIIGLTGGIASGKNFVAEIFAKNGAAVFDADIEVHKIFVADKALIAKIAKLAPSSLVNGEIDRKILGQIVFADKEKLHLLEKIIHPAIRKKYDEFLAKARKENKKFAVLNIPLLLEKQGYKCDKIIALLVPPSIQKRRFFSRKKNESKKESEKKFKEIICLQLTNKQRKEKSDFTINTRFSKAHTAAQVKKILQKL